MIMTHNKHLIKIFAFNSFRDSGACLSPTRYFSLSLFLSFNLSVLLCLSVCVSVYAFKSSKSQSIQIDAEQHHMYTKLSLLLEWLDEFAVEFAYTRTHSARMRRATCVCGLVHVYMSIACYCNYRCVHEYATRKCCGMLLDISIQLH